MLVFCCPSMIKRGHLANIPLAPLDPAVAICVQILLFHTCVSVLIRTKWVIRRMSFVSLFVPETFLVWCRYLSFSLPQIPHNVYFILPHMQMHKHFMFHQFLSYRKIWRERHELPNVHGMDPRLPLTVTHLSGACECVFPENFSYYIPFRCSLLINQEHGMLWV